MPNTCQGSYSLEGRLTDCIERTPHAGAGGGCRFDKSSDASHSAGSYHTVRGETTLIKSAERSKVPSGELLIP
jgi:hypothetical protein